LVAADEKETKLDIDALKPCHGKYDLTYRVSLCVSGWQQVVTDAYGLAGDLGPDIDPTDPHFLSKLPTKLSSLMKTTLTATSAVIRDGQTQIKSCTDQSAASECRAVTQKLDADFAALLSEFVHWAPYIHELPAPGGASS
jgi:hypothetical protein